MDTREFFNKLAPTWSNFTTEEQIKKVKTLLDKLDIKEGTRVLDLACGTGVISNTLYDYSKRNVLAIDISDKMIEEAKRLNENSHIKFINQDFYTFNTIPFDYIVIYNAYPHFLELDKFKKKLYDLLDENGEFMICHSLSREALKSHHSGEVSTISRDLKEVKEEASFYNDLFDIEYAYEDDESYMIIGRKKCIKI